MQEALLTRRYSVLRNTAGQTEIRTWVQIFWGELAKTMLLHQITPKSSPTKVPMSN